MRVENPFEFANPGLRITDFWVFRCEAYVAFVGTRIWLVLK